MADDRGYTRNGSFAVTGLFVLACLYTIYLARPVLLPLTLGLVLDFLFRPAVRAMKKRARIPEPAGAALVILVLCGGFALSVYQLSGPASAWLAKAPRSLPQVEARLRKVLRPVEKVTETAAQVERITNPKDDLPEVQMKEPGLGAMLFGGTQAFLESAVVVLTLLFFLLASGDLFLRRVIAVVAGPKDRIRAGEIAHEIEKQVSRYLYASTGINVLFGVVTALVTYALGLPNALLWGAVAGLTSFIPYLGGLIAAALIGMAGLLTFTDTGPVVTIVLVFLLLDTLKGYILYPLVMGKQFTMNAVMLFVALTFWWWAWGITGALLAVPLMAILKIFSERMDGLAPLAKLLEE
jgi:predicted PurR-regulated permease PerM